MFHKAKLLAVATLLAACAPADALWPQPRSLQSGSTPLRLAPTFVINVAPVHNPPADLLAAALSAEAQLHNDKLGRLVVGRGAADTAAYSKAKALPALTLSLGKGAAAHPIAAEAQKAPEARDEAYTLTVPGDGSAASLTANSTLGLFRGLSTFTQLFFYNEGTNYLLNAPLHIDDAPAYVRAIPNSSYWGR